MLIHRIIIILMTGQAEPDPEDTPEFLGIKGPQVLPGAMLELFAINGDKGIQRHGSRFLQGIHTLTNRIKFPFPVFLHHRAFTEAHSLG